MFLAEALPPCRRVIYGYDIFGNMLTRERTDELFAAPAGFEFDMGSSPMMRNRVVSSMGDYDAGGRMTRVPGNAGAMMSLLWDAEDRLRVTYGSPVESGGSPSAWNFYDASGHEKIAGQWLQPAAGAEPPTIAQWESINGDSQGEMVDSRRDRGRSARCRVQLGVLDDQRSQTTDRHCRGHERGQVADHVASGSKR